MICDHTTWVPHFHPFALLCHQLRALYFQHGIWGNNGLGGRNCATIFYRRHLGGNICHVTCSSESGVGASRHSERVCYDELLAREGWGGGHAAGQVLLVYTERFPCGPQNHNCFGFLDGWLPDDTAVFWSFLWPDANDFYKPTGKTKRKRDDSDWKTSQKMARQGRTQGTKELKMSLRDIDYSSGSSQTGKAKTIDGPVQDIAIAGAIGRVAG